MVMQHRTKSKPWLQLIRKPMGLVVTIVINMVSNKNLGSEISNRMRINNNRSNLRKAIFNNNHNRLEVLTRRANKIKFSSKISHGDNRRQTIKQTHKNNGVIHSNNSSSNIMRKLLDGPMRNQPILYKHLLTNNLLNS